ncbi:MAG: LacI family transcriptional regulator [Halanaerobiales bacterium]|nr:LacI family transcriptional regulator [Halanaerobiales bacterium]
MKNVTIKDVARQADVSPSTVSRVISNSPRISPETSKRVRDTMKELGYHPNAIARSLVMQKTNTIGLVLARRTDTAFANPFFTEIIQGIAVVAQQSHFNLMLSAAQDYHQEREEVLKMFQNRMVDGVILMASRVNDELIKKLQQTNSPFVLIGRSLEIDNIPIVNNNNIKAAYQMTDFLIGKGYRKIAAISGPADYVVSQDRMKGYQQALQEHGIPFKEELIRYCDFSYEGGYEAALAILKDNEIDAFFAFDDMMAFGTLRAAEKLGFAVPDQLAVAGFNDDPIVAYFRPALTTVKIPILKMGEAAARMLIRIIKEEDYSGEEVIIPTEIIPRESV